MWGFVMYKGIIHHIDFFINYDIIELTKAH